MANRWLEPSKKSVTAGDITGTWERTFAQVSRLGRVQARLFFASDGHFVQQFFIDGESQPIEARGTWRIDKERGVVSLDEGVVFTYYNGWQHRHTICYIRSGSASPESFEFYGGVDADPDSFERFQRSSKPMEELNGN